MSDPIEEEKSNSLTSVIVDGLSSIQYKFFGCMFLIFIIISSDSFIDRVLGRFGGAVDGKKTTSYGVVIQGLMLVLLCVAIEALIKHEVI